MMRNAAAIVAVVTTLAGSSAAQDTTGMPVLQGRVFDAQQVSQKDAAVCARVVASVSAGHRAGFLAGTMDALTLP